MTICGSEMSGIASSGAFWMEYRLATTPAAIRTNTIALKRMIFLMIVVSITRCVLPCGLQFEFGIDEKASDRDHLGALIQTMQNLRVQFPLYTRVNLLGYVVAGMLLDIDDSLLSFFDNGFVGNRQEEATLRNDLHDVLRTVFAPRSGQRRFNHQTSALIDDTRDSR